MRRKLAIVTIWLVVLSLVAISVSVFLLNSIVKSGIETLGSQVAKVEIKIEGDSVSLFSGSGQPSGLFMGNPPGLRCMESGRTPRANKISRT